MKFDMHVHSIHSLDSINFPLLILKMMKMKNIDGVLICDHNRLAKWNKWKKKFKSNGKILLTGIEIKTEYGDLIVITNKKIKNSKIFEEIIDLTKSENLITILPHPFRAHKNISYLAKKVDLIEIFNSKSTKKQNEKAKILAKKMKKGITAGSDAHFPFEIGNAYVEMNYTGDLINDLKKAKYFGKQSFMSLFNTVLQRKQFL